MSAIKRKAARTVQRASAPMRSLPGFLIIGGIRCGTTSMIRYLGDHPDIGIASTKEVHFYDWHYDRGETWYRSWFPLAVKGQPELVGESSPSYLMNSNVPERVAASIPDVKLIVLLRNPADRAVSHYQYRKNRGMEEAPSLDTALSEEPLRIELRRERNGHTAGRLDCYFDQGSYVNGLRRWMDAFPSEQFHVLRSEDLFNDAATAHKGVLDFLDIETVEREEYQVHNSAGYETRDHPLRPELIERYAPLNQELYQLLGRDMDWS